MQYHITFCQYQERLIKCYSTKGGQQNQCSTSYTFKGVKNIFDSFLKIACILLKIGSQSLPAMNFNHRSNIYLLKVDNTNRKRCEIFVNLTSKTPEMVSLLLAFNIFHSLF